MFMWGPAPIRRTLDYLKSGGFIAKDFVRIMEIHYHLHGRRYQTKEEKEADQFNGLRQFYFWEMPRIQYKNPQLQIIRILDKMPTPYIRFWLDDSEDVIIDCFGQSHQEILSRIIRTLGKTEERLLLEKSVRQGSGNPPFGYGRDRFCGCEVPGQHPCPGVVLNPEFDQLEVDISKKN